MGHSSRDAALKCSADVGGWDGIQRCNFDALIIPTRFKVLKIRVELRGLELIEVLCKRLCEI